MDYQTSFCKDICPEGFRLKDGQCLFTDEICENKLSREEFERVPVANNDIRQLHGNTFMILGKSTTHCYECNQTRAITNDTQDYEITGDGRVKVKSFLAPPNFVYNVDNITYYVCLDAVIEISEDNRNYQAEEIITYMLLSLSLLSLVLYFIAYLIFNRLRNVPGKIVLGNMLCLFFAYVFFLLRHLPGLEGTTGCTAVAILINYFFLASFTFNIIYAGFIVHSLDTMEFEGSATKWTAIRLWIVGLLVPLMVVAPGIVMDQMPDSVYQPRYGEGACFIPHQLGQVLYFIAPIGLCLLVAIILYIIIIAKLVQLAKETSMVRSNHSEKIAVAIKLLIVLGFNWIFAVIAAIDRGPITSLLFIVTCTLQGFFAFIVFICNRATFVDFKKCLNKQSGLNFEMSSSNPGANGKHTLSSAVSISKVSLQTRDSSKVLLKATDSVNV